MSLSRRVDPAPIVIFILTLVVFGNTLFHRFTYDDHRGIEGNEFIASFKNLPRIFTRDYFKETHELSYRPVVTATYFLDHAIWGKRPGGYHLSNVILHALSAVLFFYFLGVWFKDREARIFSSLLFALHPVVCEPVNSISFREDILAALFVLAALLVVFRASRLPDLVRVFLFSLFTLLALFSKESAMSLVLIVHLYWILRRGKNDPGFIPGISKRLMIGLGAVFLFYIIVRFFVMKPVSTGKTLILGGSIVAAAAHGGYLFLKAWRLFFFPVRLNADYVFGDMKGFFYKAFLGMGFVVGYLVFLWFLFKKRYHKTFFALIWILLFFLPVSNLWPLANPFAERYLYLPLMGFAFVMGIAWLALKKALASGDTSSKAGFPRYAAAIFLLLLSWLSVQRNLVWSMDQTLWSATLEREPRSVRAMNGIALSCIGKEKFDEAEVLLENALALAPRDYEVMNNLAVVYIRTLRPGSAEDLLERSLREKPDFAPALFNLGRLYISKGKEGRIKARELLRKAAQYGYRIPQSVWEELENSGGDG